MNVTVCPGCGAQNSFIKWKKTGTQTTLAGKSHEDVMEKRKAPVCGNCGRTYQVDEKGRYFLNQYGKRVYARNGSRRKGSLKRHGSKHRVKRRSFASAFMGRSGD
jgi:predicted RNA-binding Zn-ribbon protein involved in translation (DUF1610 family)